MIDESTIEQMSPQERLRAMELLWRSLSCAPEGIPSPEWHREVLAARVAEIERGEAQFLTLDELKQRLSRPYSIRARPIEPQRRDGRGEECRRAKADSVTER